MPAGPYFTVKYFYFTFTTNLAFGDTLLQRHNLFGPFDDIIREFDCIMQHVSAFTKSNHHALEEYLYKDHMHTSH